MNLMAAASPTSGWEILLAIAVLIFVKWLAIGCHKEEIRAAIRKKGAKPLRIHWLPTLLGSRGGPSYYEATFALPSGEHVTTECSCEIVNGVYWKDGTWPTDKSKKAESETGLPDTRFLRVVADCPRCGYAIVEGADACPNCGTEVNG
jgi:zinc-ribbon domain